MLVRIQPVVPFMQRIYQGVYVGDDTDYVRSQYREDFSFLRCCKYGPGGHQQTLDYHTPAAPEGDEHFVVKRERLMALNMLDLDDPNFVDPEMIKAGLDFVREQLLSEQKVLIACNQGVSRGPTMGLMFLKYIGDLPNISWLRSVYLYHHMYRGYDASQGIAQFARSHWSALGEGRI
jgi:hypothetical protein